MDRCEEVYLLFYLILSTDFIYIGNDCDRKNLTKRFCFFYHDKFLVTNLVLTCYRFGDKYMNMLHTVRSNKFVDLLIKSEIIVWLRADDENVNRPTNLIVARVQKRRERRKTTTK